MINKVIITKFECILKLMTHQVITVTILLLYQIYLEVISYDDE